MKQRIFKIFLLVFMVSITINVHAVTTKECVDNYLKTGTCESLSGCKEMVKANGTSCVARDTGVETNKEQNVTYDNYSNSTVSCGKGLIKKIPSLIPKTISLIYIVLEIAIPIVLVIFGMLDLFKSLTAQKEDEIKKGQQIFVKRIITAILVFFVFVITKALISMVADNNKEGIISCAECFVKNKCDE